MRVKISNQQGQGVREGLFAFVLFISLLLPGFLQAQERRGRLSNGLNYILRYSSSPRQKLEARLVMRFGSEVQRPEEAGFAHFVEHLAFSGSRHFPQGGAVRYAERLGARYGVGINALTGYDRTIYMLSLPTDEPQVLDSTCLLLGDWITGLTFDAPTVEKEKRIIKEEIRTFVQDDPFYALKIGRGKAAQGLPVGTAEDIDRATYPALSRFYQQWYRPSHATVLLVGDFDLQEAEHALQQHLGKLPSRPSILSPEQPLSYRPGLEQAIVTDSLRSSLKLDLIFPYTTRSTRSLLTFFQDRLYALALGAWSHRLEPLREASLTDHWYLGRSNHLALTLEASHCDSLRSLLSESLGALNVLRRQGISAEELEALKHKQLARCYLVDSTASSEAWAGYYLDQILHGDFFLTSPAEIRQLHQLFDRLRPEQLQPIFRSLYRTVASPTRLAGYLSHPSRPELQPLDSADLSRTIQRGLHQPTSRLGYHPRPIEEENMAEVPTPDLLRRPKSLSKTSLHRQAYPKLGLVEARLENGLRILLRPTSSGDSIVKLTLTQQAGLRHIPRSRQKQLASLAAYIEMGGIAKLPKAQLDSFLYDRGIALTLTEGMDAGTLFGTAPTATSYALLRLMYEKATDPERAYADFEESRQSLLQGLGAHSPLAQRLARQGERQLQRRLDSVLGIFVPTAEPETAEEIRALQLDSLVAYHIDQWTRTEGMTLTAVGDFSPEELLKEIAYVFGPLPRRPVMSYPYSADPQRESVYTLTGDEAGDEATLQHVYYGAYEPSLRGSLRLKLMREVLRNRLIDRLRTQAGIIYSPYLYLEYRPQPEAFASFRLELLVRPENIPLAGKLVEELVEELQQTPPTAQELADISRTFLINKREALTEQDMSAWQEALLTLIRQQESLQDFADYESILRSITPEEVRAGFRSVFSPTRHLIYSFVPKQ